MNSSGIVVGIDVDNLLISALEEQTDPLKFAGFEAGFHNLFKWLFSFGKIISVHFFLSPFQASDRGELWNNLWQQYKDDFIIEFIFCPKKIPRCPTEKPDNVDAHLIYYMQHVIDHCNQSVQYFCLGAGDSDYSVFLRSLSRKNIQIAFEIGNQKSFSGVYKRARFLGKHPKTKEDLVHQFWPRKEESK